MADRLIRNLVLSGALAAAALSSLPARAQTGSPPDPTRPPNVSEVAGANTSAPAPTGLQAVILRPGGKSVAVINGQTVAVGGMVGDARLVSLTANEAVLSGPNGKEILKLAPAVDKTQSASARPAAKTKKRISGRGEGHE
jgi:MSHA biogenesis protein MshK